jgi:hypothetical protein
MRTLVLLLLFAVPVHAQPTCPDENEDGVCDFECATGEALNELLDIVDPEVQVTVDEIADAACIDIEEVE